MTANTGMIVGSPAIQHAMERSSLDIQLADFSEERHLVDRERQYCITSLNTLGIYVIRETEEGWWRESIDFKGDVQKQVEKLKNDPTVACGWLNTMRFNEPGGWYDPN